MKDLNIKASPRKMLHIPALTGGLDLRNLSHAPEQNILRDCKNIWQNRGILETRPALFTDKNCILNEEYYYSDPSPTKLTKIEYEYNGIIYRMSYKSVEVDVATHFCYTTLISPEGKPFKNAKIIFMRTTADTFYIPQKFNFFKGKPSSSGGTGIYVLVKLVNCENSSEISSRIYELSISLEYWNEVFSTYVPTVLINGRGNKYEQAKQTDQVFTAAPKKLEALNALTGEFYSYFSSDGYSSSFKLPYSSLSQSPVTAQFYYSATNYVVWQISASATQATTNLNNVSITMKLDRANGVVSFSSSGGEFSLPLAYDKNENNLRILARKESGYKLTDLADADDCISLNGKILLSSKNRIFSSDFENPLYFPAESVCTFWGDDTRITALIPFDQKLLAFCKNRIYLGAIKDGKQLNSYSLLSTDDSIFKAPHSIELECVDYNIGCCQKSSIITDQKEVFFLSSNGMFYSFSQNKTKNISEKIEGFLPSVLGEYSLVCTTKYADCILFLWENKALCFDPTKGNNAWYYWEFGENIKITDCYTTNKGSRFLIFSTTGTLHYTATFKGNVDTTFKGDNSSAVLGKSNIPCLISTANLSPLCTAADSFINSINLSLTGEKVQISINDIFKTVTSRKDTENLVKLVSPITKSSSIYIDIKGVAPLSFGSVCIDYTEVGY